MPAHTRSICNQEGLPKGRPQQKGRSGEPLRPSGRTGVDL